MHIILFHSIRESLDVWLFNNVSIMLFRMVVLLIFIREYSVLLATFISKI